MATNLEIVSDALRLVGVIAEGETPSAEQGQSALRRLNQMVEAWTVNGIDFGYTAQSAITDDSPLPQWAQRGVISKLAQDLSASYPSSQLPEWMWNDQDNGYSTILRKCLNDQLETANMDHLPRGGGNLSGAQWDDITQ